MRALGRAADAATAPAGRASLLRWRSPGFWVFWGLVAATGVRAAAQQTATSRISPSGWLVSWALMALYALPILIAVYLLDLYRRERLSLAIAALAWGAVAATTLAGVADQGWAVLVARIAGPGFAARWTAALTAPWVEETVKAAGLVLLATIAPEEFDDVMDGFVYGAVCGLGFAIVEDVFSFLDVFGGSPSQVLAGFYVRVVSDGLYGHVLFTGVAGMGVAVIASRRGVVPAVRRRVVAVALFAVAVLAHFLWNSPFLDLFPSRIDSVGELIRVPIAAAVKGLPLLAFAAVAATLARARERRWLGAALRSETGFGAISATELGILLDPLARRRSRAAMRRRAGGRAARVLARMQREQVNLAMLRARPDVDELTLERQRAYCRSLRDALRAIPGAAPAEQGG